MVKIKPDRSMQRAGIGPLFFFFYFSISKHSVVPCFGLSQKRGDSFNTRLRTDKSHFSSFALNYSFQTCERERDFRKQVEDYGKESCLRSIGTLYTSYPQYRLTSVFQKKYPSWRLLLPISQNVGRSGISRVAFRVWKTWRKTTFNDRK